MHFHDILEDIVTAMGRRRRRKNFVTRIFARDDRSLGRSDRGGRLLDVDFDMSDETKRGVAIIVCFVVAVLCLLGLFELSGQFGRYVVLLLGWALGGMRWLLPVILLLFGYFLIRTDLYRVRFVNYFGAVLVLVSMATLWHLRYDPTLAYDIARDGAGGGYLGAVVALPLIQIMDVWGAVVLCFAVLLIGLLLVFETSLYGLMWPVRALLLGWHGLKRLLAWLRERRPATDEIDDAYEAEPAPARGHVATDDAEDAEPDEAPRFSAAPITAVADDAETPAVLAPRPKKFGKRIDIPLDILTSRSGKPTSGDIKSNQEIIKRTLANFGISVEMSNVNIGPTVTQYTFRPADGVRIAKITNLNSDLALALAAHPIRIEAPIPGKSLVGVEVPNEVAAKVTMHDLLSSKAFKERTSNLLIALGKDVSGHPYFASLDRMPHLLIAGATGSGKSVCVNAIITSLLYQNSPDELKFIMVDPKRVELPAYNNIPYLLTPVITDVKKTIQALKWAVVEMERRFETLAKAGKRNIQSYNESSGETLPYIVFIIDELADLMASSANDVEAGIVRLAQMARAVGIHLILATQRPSVEVITGLIKANIPARIAFSVASLIDSRTILDSAGAEKLVGRGDMLYLGPDVAQPKRIQGVFVADREIHDIVGYIRDQGDAAYVEEIAGGTAGAGSAGSALGGDDGDPLLSETKEIIRQSGKASASLLQRRLKVGYARAARILDLLEEQGVIGPADGAKPREIYLDKLQGVSNVVAFAAREHNLEGELRPLGDEDELSQELNEPEPLVVFQEEMPPEHQPAMADPEHEIDDSDFTAPDDTAEELDDDQEMTDDDSPATEEVTESIDESEAGDEQDEPTVDATPAPKPRPRRFADDDWG